MTDVACTTFALLRSYATFVCVARACLSSEYDLTDSCSIGIETTVSDTPAQQQEHDVPYETYGALCTSCHANQLLWLLCLYSVVLAHTPASMILVLLFAWLATVGSGTLFSRRRMWLASRVVTPKVTRRPCIVCLTQLAPEKQRKLCSRDYRTSVPTKMDQYATNLHGKEILD